MKKKKGKSGVRNSLRSISQEDVIDLTEDQRACLEMALIVTETMSGVAEFDKEEGLNFLYAAFQQGVTVEQLPRLGKRVAAIQSQALELQ